MNISYPILYSFRRCPYAMRARLALYNSNTTCELREVVLKDKPQAMLDISPKGTVPVLQLIDGTVMDESLDIMLWALQMSDPNCWLKPDMLEVIELIEVNDSQFKNDLDRYKYPDRYENVDPLEHRHNAELFIAGLEKRVQKTKFILGDKPCLADYAILPFIRQFAFVDKAWFDSTNYKALQHWLESFINSQLFKAVMPKYPKWTGKDDIILFGQ
ncbi:MAG: glutathione S-transferase [Magnetococcales bacterium]|nr:glutathione S-transferase [Magnetococcales bacterium]